MAALGLALAPAMALADPGNGNGNGITNNPHVPPGQSDQDLTQPQEPSNADFTDNGANTSGPYDSTRDGSPSLNGNGTGEAVGKPCAGCVGKADNKNPPGQMPDGSDLNAGYECDTNHGIGKTNPAHTGCKPTTPPTSSTPPPSNPPSSDTPAPPGGAQAGGEAAKAAADELAFTGFDLLPAGLAGLVLVGAGGTALVVGRRSRRS
ncbi:hypothetical protein Lesp02_40570 [Lentzea sp. NBRC 105346]|uniref:hypothetical protein n=1 Tax=Lentzea sp. NBRC 105346 TaxID=3032205 RepID=UPI0024A3A168|nr:hypothetical protein [Lentzea sp. NBRC 105346]GLZ31869.1 hypothetical protein Lesp02_40570 [Lentzea sp. NBRC 105346]